MPMSYYAEDITGEEINPYEAVIACSKEARRLNQTRVMVDLPEGSGKVTTLAIKRLAEKKIRLSYSEEADEEEAEDGSQ